MVIRDLLSFPNCKTVHISAFDELQLFFFIFTHNETVIIIGKTLLLENDNQSNALVTKLADQDDWTVEERVSINRFLINRQFPRALEWISGHIMLKNAIKIYLGNDDQSIELKLKEIQTANAPSTEISYPVIQRNGATRFNLKLYLSISHTQSEIYTLVAPISAAIDVELIKPRSDQWIKKVIKESELSTLTSYFDKQLSMSRDELFTLLWCLKEATIKVNEIKSLGTLFDVTLHVSKDKLLTWNPVTNQYHENYVIFIAKHVLVISIVQDP